MKIGISALALLAIASRPLQAAQVMDKHQAQARAAELLLGDPYGGTVREVSRVLRDAQFVGDGTTLCGRNIGPVWRFHVVVEEPATSPENRIDGYLFLNALSGKMTCANLPLLD
jgi:hypothetical protein